jgi:hypothetical protein
MSTRIVPQIAEPLWQVHLAHGTKGILAYLHGPGSWSRFRSAAMVGAGRNNSNLFLELVGGLSQRLVLEFRTSRGHICCTAVCSSRPSVLFARPVKRGIGYTATLSLIASLGAFTRSCLVPRYRSVVWTDAWPNSNWICSSSPPAARHNFAHVRRRRGAQFRGHLRPLRMASSVARRPFRPDGRR